MSLQNQIRVSASSLLVALPGSLDRVTSPVPQLRMLKFHLFFWGFFVGFFFVVEHFKASAPAFGRRKLHLLRRTITHHNRCSAELGGGIVFQTRHCILLSDRCLVIILPSRRGEKKKVKYYSYLHFSVH